MLRFALAVCLSVSTLVVAAQTNPLVKINSAEKTLNSIILTGQTKVLPGNLKMKAEVTKINGKDLNNSEVIESDWFASTADGGFKAVLQRHGSMSAYEFPNGKYQIEIHAGFGLGAQTMDVRRAVGMEIDSEGKSYMDDPLKNLPKSSDLVPFGIEKKGRALTAIRSVEVKPIPNFQSKYKTKTILIELHDYLANRNPVKSIKATDWLVTDVNRKIGTQKSSVAVALVCEGAGYGILADDLYRSGGQMNSRWQVNHYTTLMEICHQMEGNFPFENLNKNK